MAKERKPGPDGADGMPDYRRMFADRVRDIRKPSARRVAPRGSGAGRGISWVAIVVVFGVVRLCAGINSSSRYHPRHVDQPVPPRPIRTPAPRPPAGPPGVPADQQRLDELLRQLRERQQQNAPPKRFPDGNS